MMQSLYEVLEVPTTATSTEIRTAYRRQLERLGAGELSSSLRPLVERACATLEDPSRRASYDVRLARLPRWVRPPTVEPPSHAHLPVQAMVATAASLAVALAVLLAVLPSRGHHSAPKPSQTAVSEVVPPGSPTIAEDANAPQEDVSTGPSEPQQPVQMATTRPATAQRAPTGAARLPEAEAAAQPAVEDAVAAPAAPAAPPAPPALVISAPYGRIQANSSSRLEFRTQGWFCHDSSGGEVFVSAGAPLPGGVSC